MSLRTRLVGAFNAALDAWGQGAPSGAIEAAAGSRSLSAEVAIPPPWQERDPAILGNRLTPTGLAQIIRGRNEGYFQPWVDLGTEFLSKNPHLVTQLGIRRASVLETTIKVRPGKGTNAQGARRAAKDFEDLLTRWRQRQEYDAVCGQVIGAEWWGRSLHELVWSDDAGPMCPEQAAWVHPRRLSYACPYSAPDPWVLRLHDPDDPYSDFFGAYGVPITKFHPDKFLLHETQPLGVQKTGEGLFAGAVWYLLMYEWSWRDLLLLVELLGRPGVIGYYAAGGAKAASRGAKGQLNADGSRNASDDEVAQLQRVLSKVSGSLRAALADTTRVEALQMGQKGEPLQLEAIKHLEDLLSKLVSGTTGVTDIVAGARAAHQVAWQQSLTFWRYDVRRWCGWLWDLASRMVAANPGRYGLGCPVPEAYAQELEPAAEVTTKPAPKGDGTKGDGTKADNAPDKTAQQDTAA